MEERERELLLYYTFIIQINLIHFFCLFMLLSSHYYHFHLCNGEPFFHVVYTYIFVWLCVVVIWLFYVGSKLYHLMLFLFQAFDCNLNKRSFYFFICSNVFKKLPTAAVKRMIRYYDTDYILLLFCICGKYFFASAIFFLILLVWMQNNMK